MNAKFDRIDARWLVCCLVNEGWLDKIINRSVYYADLQEGQLNLQGRKIWYCWLIWVLKLIK